jgi:hypothetical protein
MRFPCDSGNPCRTLAANFNVARILSFLQAARLIRWSRASFDRLPRTNGKRTSRFPLQDTFPVAWVLAERSHSDRSGSHCVREEGSSYDIPSLAARTTPWRSQIR